jgi:hypothetical protein
MVTVVDGDWSLILTDFLALARTLALLEYVEVLTGCLRQSQQNNRR